MARSEEKKIRTVYVEPADYFPEEVRKIFGIDEVAEEEPEADE